MTSLKESAGIALRGTPPNDTHQPDPLDVIGLFEKADEKIGNLANVEEAVAANAAAAAESAQEAETARDSTVFNSGVFPDEEAGRAAVSDGVIFPAIGAANTSAIDIWQRTDATASVLLRSYATFAEYERLLLLLQTALADNEAAAAANLDAANVVLDEAKADAALSLAAATETNEETAGLLALAESIQTPYDVAVAGGYQGTPEEFATDQGNAATNATIAADAKEVAVIARDAALGALAAANIKAPVDLVSGLHLDLNGSETIDGFLTVDGMRVLCLNQDDKTACGIYVVDHSGPWTRSVDADTAVKLNGAIIQNVAEGLANKGRMFRVVTTVVALGSDEIVFEIVAQGGSVQQAAASSRGTIVTLSDSNWGGRIEWIQAIRAEWINSGGAFENWTVWNTSVSGYSQNGVLSSAVSGDKNAAPYNADPTDQNLPIWDGNIWRVVNAFKDADGKDLPGVLLYSLGINDMGTPSTRSSYGSPTNFRLNLARSLAFLKAVCPLVSILLVIPQPYGGEDFINTTQWASDSPLASGTNDEKIKANTAYRSKLIRSAYLEWVNKDTRISVWDSAELFGVRADDVTVDAQDPEGLGDLLDDSLHKSTIGLRRELQYVTRALGVAGRSTNSTLNLAPASITESCFFVREFWVNVCSAAGANTNMTLLSNPEMIHTGGKQRQLLPKLVNQPTKNIELVGLHSDIQDFMRVRGTFKLYFPESGETYTSSGVAPNHSFSENPDGTRLCSFVINGVNITKSAQRVIVYITDKAALPGPEISVLIPFTVVAGSNGVVGRAAVPNTDPWVANSGYISRASYSGGTDLALDVRAHNQSASESYSLSSYTAPMGAPILTSSGSANFRRQWGMNKVLDATNYPTGLVLLPPSGSGNAIPTKVSFLSVYHVSGGPATGSVSGTVLVKSTGY